MYLSKLDLEKKKLFLDLCIHAALADNDFVEKEVIDEYCVEMGLERGQYAPTKDLELVLKELKEKCSKEEINIIIIEIIALIMSDDVYNTMEKEFMVKLQKALDISEKKIEKAFNAISHLKVSYNMLNEIISE